MAGIALRSSLLRQHRSEASTKHFLTRLRDEWPAVDTRLESLPYRLSLPKLSLDIFKKTR